MTGKEGSFSRIRLATSQPVKRPARITSVTSALGRLVPSIRSVSASSPDDTMSVAKPASVSTFSRSACKKYSSSMTRIEGNSDTFPPRANACSEEMFKSRHWFQKEDDSKFNVGVDDRPRPGKEPVITPEAKAWLVSLACDKAKEHGYPHELWTTRLLARHAREHGPTAGHECLARLVQGTVCKILGQEEIKPHKVRYYLERRDAEFEQKMAEVLCVYREVQVLKRAAAKSHKAIKRVAIVSYDEKPGIQAIATTAPDLPPKPGVHTSFARDYEYKRHGTLSLLAGIDLLTGKVHALVKDRHRSREFVEFLKLLDAAYPADTAIKLILDNHSAHISKETKAWIAAQPEGRFEFTFTP